MIEHVSMPHAALWVVQPWIKESPICEYLFQCRTRLCGWCNLKLRRSQFLKTGFNAARGFVGGATTGTKLETELYSGFNAARGFVGGATAGLSTVSTTARNCFNAARGFVGGATNNERYRVR